MRQRSRAVLTCFATVTILSACAARPPVRPEKPQVEETPMPTVPPATRTPLPTAAPVQTRSIPTDVKGRKGQSIGPVITYFGAVRADGSTVEPVSVDKQGVATFRSSAGSGFILVVEAKPGENGIEVGRRVFVHDPNDPKLRPDLEIQSNRDLGNGSPQVCDRERPKIGGIPRIAPPSFAETQRIGDALNDFGCRFETFIESESSCTLSKNGDFSFVAPDSTTQFCMIVARAYSFPEGETLLTVRMRDVEGNPGPAKRVRISRPPLIKPTKKK